MLAALFLGTSLAFILSSCADNTPPRSADEQIDDQITTHQIKEAMSQDSVYKYPDVKVVTFKGMVCN